MASSAARTLRSWPAEGVADAGGHDRSASTGRPASASPSARVPSNARRRSGSPLSARSASWTSSLSSSQARRAPVPGHDVPAEAARAGPPPAVPQLVPSPGVRSTPPATQSPSSSPRSRRASSGGPEASPGRPVRPTTTPGRRAREAAPVDQQVAPGESTGPRRRRRPRRDRGDRAPDRRLAAAVVELAGLGGEEAERVPWPARLQPVLERGGISPASANHGRPWRAVGQPAGLTAAELGDRTARTSECTAEPALRTESGDEQAAFLGPHAAGASASSRPVSARRQARVEPLDHGDV